MPKWLNCTISKGMFSDEFTVSIRTRSGENVAVFVPRDLAEEKQGRVKVHVTERSGHMIAVLPDANQSVIDVESSELTPV